MSNSPPKSHATVEASIGRDEDVREALRRMRAHQDAIAAVSVSDAFIAGDVDALAREVTELSAQAAGVERAGVWLFNESESELRCIDLYEATPRRHASGAVLTAAEYQIEFRALRTARFVDADDALSDPRTAG